MRQVARLEQRALPYIEEKRRYEEQKVTSLRERAFLKATHLALLILYGDVRIGEPLIYAWRRCLKSFCEKHSYYLYSWRRRGVHQQVAEYFRKYLLPGLPGADETEKLNLVFASAPLWFLWLTHADEIGSVLGLKVMDLSSKSRYARPPVSFMRLPDGPFEWRRLPDGAEDEFYASARQHQREGVALPADLTPRERMRALRLHKMDK
jgi:hypothetical protein